MARRSFGHRAGAFLLIAAVNLAIISGAVALIELLSSLVLPAPRDYLSNDYYLNHTWTPNHTSRHTPPSGGSYDMRVNRQGWIEHYDIEEKKPESVYRIFYLGDSFTQGLCDMDSSLPSLVETELAKRASGSGVTIEVINTGTTSYSPTLFCLLLRHRVLDYDPDLIVVNVDMTDDFDDWKYLQTLVVDERGDPLAAPPRDIFASSHIDTERGAVRASAWMKVRLFLFQHSSTYNLAMRVRKKFFPFDENTTLPGGETSYLGYSRWSWCDSAWDSATVVNVAHTTGMLSRIAGLCRSRGVKLMVTSVPHYWQFAGSSDGFGEPRWSSRPHEAIRRWAAGEKVPYCNAFEELRSLLANVPQSMYYYAGDMHFNPRGNALWAGVQIRFLLDSTNGLLPSQLYLRQ